MRKQLTSLELFTGAGGLALGVAKAGFEHLGVVEWNQDACDSLRENGTRIPSMAEWPVHQADVHDFNFGPFADRVTLLAAGAPCQPFSLAGKHRGHADHRNLFPQVFRAVREVRPDAVIVENVRGLLRKAFKPYFDYILLHLEFPEWTPEPCEPWEVHARRLLEIRQNAPRDTLRYSVRRQLLNAADFGLPQKRQRVFIVAFRKGIEASWRGLEPTHTEDALLYAQWVDGSYWEEHGIFPPVSPPRKIQPRIARLRKGGPPPGLRWRTVRDGLRGLPEPKDSVGHPKILNHVGNPGARTYPGHTGSPLDEPAKTLKAGDHGVPGGENMLRRLDGSVRYFTVREAARLQGFPDEYHFRGAWSEAMRQLGNAVPVSLARIVADEARSSLDPVVPTALVA